MWKFSIVLCSVVAVLAVILASYGLHLTIGTVIHVFDELVHTATATLVRVT